ncbi:hypothetical protein PHYBLDRAFT_63749 [Phycomyces blakesleeanus NRRL 1555(-)]|uniref:Uncharacterized protein n=1 Tax=Phycomyces blakesleeanus (strain ATCC 8743b / DSM 1359 / FGSC 10004 / NBRC 33097 / NRRL 1555) TaxID=763407 RepID=A0A162WHY9_PHYB8|nr:hypothetical protein PHYBLDRAFT_63749 [Phycomyces blakesleeanus NRRL 1555(-)]OAD67255.1 hypothetical protein PHYBLDRAFT_63749 [Phycomyces blakesleeanus NRRL 1555(-)]|eukprot:XP_018285295.1 hypothetical protein PHYBLDRAFT_63749 [Phycomyces blakesleeanus NRRL 1555(-)]
MHLHSNFTFCHTRILVSFSIWVVLPVRVDISNQNQDLQVSFLIWDGLPFTIAKSKGQTHWELESILNYYTLFNYKRSPFTVVDAQKMLLWLIFTRHYCGSLSMRYL